MKKYEYKGRLIETNFEDLVRANGDAKNFYGGYSLWNGNDIPSCYDGWKTVGFRQTDSQLFDELVNKGYTRIRFVETTTRIKGYHETHAFYGKRIEED